MRGADACEDGVARSLGLFARILRFFAAGFAAGGGISGDEGCAALVLLAAMGVNAGAAGFMHPGSKAMKAEALASCMEPAAGAEAPAKCVEPKAGVGRSRLGLVAPSRKLKSMGPDFRIFLPNIELKPSFEFSTPTAGVS
jgi:hypothetical protein